MTARAVGLFYIVLNVDSRTGAMSVAKSSRRSAKTRLGTRLGRRRSRARCVFGRDVSSIAV